MRVPDYRALKSVIIKNCEDLSVPFTLDFKVKYPILENEVEKEFGLIPIPVMKFSEKIMDMDVFVLSEYLKGQNLTWLDVNKQYMIISFISKEDMDDKCKKLLCELKDQHDNPDYDRVKTISFILANYPCFNTAIISYISADPNRYGKLSYEVKIRSNTVAIKMMDAKNHSANLN